MECSRGSQNNKGNKRRSLIATGSIQLTSPPVDLTQSTIVTNDMAIQDDFIPPSLIGVSQEAADARTATIQNH